MSMKTARSGDSEDAQPLASLGDLMTEMLPGLDPPSRFLPSEAAAKWRKLNNPGSYSGDWKNETTPYMVEPMDCKSDRSIRGVVFVGPAQSSKALALGTPLVTPTGWTTMGAVKVGDQLFDEAGNPCRVVGTTEVMHGHECFEVHFEGGEVIVADAGHKWFVRDRARLIESVKTTRWMFDQRDPHSINRFAVPVPKRPRAAQFKGKDWRSIMAIKPAASVPVRCITVDSPSHLYLAGRAMIPTHNTDSLVLNLILHTIVCEPIDTIVYQTSQEVARDFSRTRVDRMLRHSPEAGARLLPGGRDDNVHDKHFRSGMVLNLSWPTINEMSGRPRGLVILTDYDRMPQNVDGEGAPFDLGQKRTTTFRSAGKTIAESSPGFEVTAGSTWIPSTRHEAPPCDGILALYNRGDRRRWYWKCPSCAEWFEPTFELLRYDTALPPAEAGAKAFMACPTSGCVITPEVRYDLNLTGRWVKDGQRLTTDDEIEGTAAKTGLASFWMQGVAAAFASWGDLVEKYMLADAEYRRTGSQTALMATVNTDQGQPYRRKGTTADRRPEDLKNQAQPGPERVVPDDVRFLVNTIDVQGRKWVVQTHGIRPGRPYDAVVIDRYDIAKSERFDADGDRQIVDPAAYLEDWALLKPVINREYPLADGSGRMMRVKMTLCDSGGRDGVTSTAYAFWLGLQRAGDGEHTRFQLVKGDHLPAAPRAHVSYPDAQRKDRKAGMRGDVPVLMLNSNILKDELNAAIGGGRVSWPDWLPDAFFTELCVEIRGVKGWENPARKRNEAWDLLYYLMGACVWLGIERLNWEKPPGWACPWDTNSLVRKPEAEKLFQPAVYDMGTFARNLA